MGLESDTEATPGNLAARSDDIATEFTQACAWELRMRRLALNGGMLVAMGTILLFLFFFAAAIAEDVEILAALGPLAAVFCLSASCCVCWAFDVTPFMLARYFCRVASRLGSAMSSSVAPASEQRLLE